MTRQAARAQARRLALEFVNLHYGPEARRPRRGIAVALAKKNWREVRAREHPAGLVVR